MRILENQRKKPENKEEKQKYPTWKENLAKSGELEAPRSRGSTTF